MARATITLHNIISGESTASLETVKFEALFWIAMSVSQAGLESVTYSYFVSKKPNSAERLRYIRTMSQVKSA